jgi:thiol peroxidase
VIDKNDKVAYREIVQEVTAEPDYEAALNAAKKLV